MMTDNRSASTSFESLDYAEKLAIDKLCDGFEAEFRRGGFPRAEEYLHRISEDSWPTAVVELMQIECVYSDKSSDIVRRSYIDRFPQLREVLVSQQLHSALRAGLMLSEYRLDSKLGAGGMGVVWKADDTELSRTVALKFLSAEFSQNSGRLKRFRSEAIILAALNHPHITALYGFQEHDGHKFCVLEYVPGMTLGEQLRKTPLTVSEAVSTFGQIAEALEYAHESGVIHRDLKPANIKVTDEGLVKVLDFGLATFVGDADPRSEHPSANQKELTTKTRSDTDVASHIAGTWPYMSPEQAAGKKVDKRSDIWSFGCCLYEALSGHKPFACDNAAELRQALAATEPDWALLPNQLPHELEQLIRRCLEKDPRQRLRDIGEARIKLHNGFTKPTDKPARSRPIAVALGVITAAIATTLLISASFWLLQQGKSSPQESRLSVNLPGDFRLVPHGMAISPNGTHLVFAAVDSAGESHLYVRRKDRIPISQLENTAGARFPFFSPDGLQIGFCTYESVNVISLSGANRRTIWRGTGPTKGGCWTEDDTIIFSYNWGTRLAEVSVDGSKYKLLGYGALGYPQVLPEGETLLLDGRVLSMPLSQLRRQSELVELGSLVREIIPNCDFLRYVATGHVIYHDSGNLYAASFQCPPPKLTGKPELLVKTDFNTLDFEVAAAGDVVFSEGQSQQGELAWVDAKTGETSVVWQGARRYSSFRLSPDCQSVAVGVEENDGVRLWIYDLRTQTPSLLVAEGNSERPAWSDDGTQIVFRWTREGESAIYCIDLGSPNAPERLSTANTRSPTHLVSIDGHQKLFHYGGTPDDMGEMYAYDMETGVDDRLFRTANVDECFGALSSDRNWILYLSTQDTLDYQVFVAPYPELTPSTRISRSSALDPIWSSDGKRVFYRGGDLEKKEIRSTVIDFDPLHGKAKGGSIETVHTNSLDCPGYSFDYDQEHDRFLIIKPTTEAPRQGEVLWLQNALR